MHYGSKVSKDEKSGGGGGGLSPHSLRAPFRSTALCSIPLCAAPLGGSFVSEKVAMYHLAKKKRPYFDHQYLSFPIFDFWNLVSFDNSLKFPMKWCYPHPSILLHLEMRAIWKKSSYLKSQKLSILFYFNCLFFLPLMICFPFVNIVLQFFLLFTMAQLFLESWESIVKFEKIGFGQ